MFGILAMLPAPVMLLILIVIAIALLIVIPKLKKSRSVDKLAEGLFSAPKKDTVENILGSIKDGKNGLKDKVKENAEVIKEKLAEQKKINDNL